LPSFPDRVGNIDLESGPPSISDYALVRRQFHIFERALKKFKSDVGLWIQYIQVAKKEGARALVGRITARFVVHMVRLVSTQVDMLSLSLCLIS
jgi:hypothetical protein